MSTQTFAVSPSLNEKLVSTLQRKFTTINGIVAASDELVDVFYTIKQQLINLSITNVIVIDSEDKLEQIFTTILDNVCLSHVVHNDECYYERTSSVYERNPDHNTDHDPDMVCESDMLDYCETQSSIQEDDETYYALYYSEEASDLYVDSPLKTLVALTKDLTAGKLKTIVYHEAGYKCVNHCAINLTTQYKQFTQLPVTLHNLALLITGMKIDKFSKSGNLIEEMTRDANDWYTILMGYSYALI